MTRDRIEPATTAITRFDVRSRHPQVVFVLGAAGAYILVFVTLYSRMGPGLAALSGLPVIAAGWLLGLRAGLVAWFLFLPLNTLLFNLVGLSGWDTVFRNGGGPGTLVTLIIAAVAGRLFDLREELKREISERKRAEEALRLIVEGTSRTFGADFFRSLVQHLATALEVRFAFVSEIHEDREERLRLLAHWEGNDFGENFEYDIKGTPCEHVIEKGSTYYPENVQQLFPDDDWLKESCIESYLAIPLLDSEGHPQGHLGVAHDNPMPNSRPAQSILRIFASRAGAELLRKRAEEALHKAHDELEIRVQQRTAELEGANRELQSEITNRKQVEKRETQLGRIVEESLDEILIFDAKTFRFLQVNRGARENLGYSMQELSAMTPLDVKPQVTPEQFMEIAAPLLNGEQKRVEFETVHRRKDGSPYNVEAHLQLAELDNKSVFVAYDRDITARKRAEETLRKSEERFRSVFEQAGVAVGVAESRTGRFVQINSKYADLIGYSNEEITKKTWMEISYPDDIQENLDKTHDLAKGKISEFSLEKRLIHKDGSVIWINLTVSPIWNSGETPKQHIVIVEDITERKRAEDALRRSEQNLADFFENATVGLHWVGPDGIILRANQAELDLVGYTREEYVGRHIADFHADQEVIQDMLRRLESHETLHDYKARLRCKDGSIKYVLINSNVLWEDGQFIHTRCFTRDITKRKQAEDALRVSHRQLEETLDELKQTQQQVIQQERLRAVGQLAGGVAHDLNNSLSPVLGYAEMLAAAADLPEKLREWALLIEMGARDAAAVVERLREFYRPQGEDEGDHTAVNLHELMTQIPQLTRPKWRDEAQRTGRNIDIELDLEGEVFVHGTPGELREILTNLVFNAVDAMPVGGEITLHLSSTPECAVIEVTDTGIGMLDDVASRCFEPFFTAKGSGGTGLGLSVCHGIVQRHGGRFEIDTEPGHGTTMRIILRLAVQDELAEREEPIVAALPSRRVLYIDDDLRLRQLVSTLLEELGQKVDLAKSGAEGLELFQQNQYDVVLTDLGMPGIDGREVTRIIKTTRQDVPVIMVTGWGSPSLQQRVDGAVEPDQLVPKPLTLAKLREALEKAFA